MMNQVRTTTVSAPGKIRDKPVKRLATSQASSQASSGDLNNKQSQSKKCKQVGTCTVEQRDKCQAKS
jgi:hypothetical protein